ncbi:MAG TPA: diacylglycerol kinase family protein [Thermoanaerobaculia bacterium]|nr:diacylglycerol kinase family protein [Thermoanaerobaculia bacterium]
MPANGTLFLNRNSGAKIGAAALDELRQEAARAGIEIVELSPGLDCSQEIRERVRRGVKLFIAAGGDGTVQHVLQAVAHSDSTLAVLPLGTYNHFARDLDVPLDWRAALDVALSGESKQVDLGRINERYFANNVSIGLYPELVAKREERGRDYPRWKARLFALYTTLRKYPHVTLSVETAHHNEVLRTHVFMISNNRYDLERIGIEASRETLTEGKLSVYWLPHTSRWRLTRFLARYAAGRVRTIPGFRSFKTLRMRVQTPRDHLKVGIDGEVFTLQTPLVVTAAPQSLLVKVPRKDASA